MPLLLQTDSCNRIWISSWAFELNVNLVLFSLHSYTCEKVKCLLLCLRPALRSRTCLRTWFKLVFHSLNSFYLELSRALSGFNPLVFTLGPGVCSSLCFCVDNDSFDQRPVLCSHVPQTRSVPITPLEPWLIHTDCDSVLVLMES